MAWEAPGQIVSFPTTSTGIAQYRYVNISTAGNLIYTVSNGFAVGITQAGSTGSTTPPTSLPVMISGISKLAVSTASTIGRGELIAATSRGSAKPAAAASYVTGQVVAGTSGGASRVLSVLIMHTGSTALV